MRASVNRRRPAAKFPSLADLEFYKATRPFPAWVATVERHHPPNLGEAIEHCVNSHGGLESTDGELAAMNLIEILRSMRKRGKVLDVELGRIALAPGCLIGPEKRAAFAKKWCAKMQQRSTKEGVS